MSQQKKASKTKVKRKLDTSMIIIVVGLVIIAIPFLVLGGILLSDSLKTGTPISGDRFNADLDPAITEKDLDEVQKAVFGLDEVESAEVILKTATLRVYLDTTDALTKEQAQALAEEAYTEVTDILSVSTYFSQQGTKKMYDLEIHVYNLSENRESDEFVYVIANKSSSMEEKIVQIVSEPKDPELAQQLNEKEEAKNNPTPTPETEITVGGDNDEASDEGGEE